MLGQQVSYDRAPYFFTDQYDVGMEFTGWFPPGGYDALIIRSGVQVDRHRLSDPAVPLGDIITPYPR